MQRLKASGSRRRWHEDASIPVAPVATSGHLILCNAGHPRPLLYRAETARWQLLDHCFEGIADELLNLPLGDAHWNAPAGSSSQ